MIAAIVIFGLILLGGFFISMCVLAGTLPEIEDMSDYPMPPPSAPVVNESAVICIRGGNSHQRRVQRRADTRNKLTVDQASA